MIEYLPVTNGRSLRLLTRWACACIFILLSVATTHAQTTSWINTSGDFGTPSNWSNGTPDSSTSAYFTGITGTVSVTSDQTAQALYFQNSSNVTLDLTGTYALALTGPSSAHAADVYQNSSLVLTGTGTLEVQQQSFVVGYNDGVSSPDGTMSITGDVQVNLDYTGYTDLIVGHGEDITGTTTGVLNQSGNSEVTLGSNMIIGVSGGTGIYTLSGSAVLTTGSQESYIYIGLNQTGDNPTSNAQTSGTLILDNNSEFNFANGYVKLGDNLDNGTSFVAGNGTIIQNDSSVVNVTSTLGGAFSIGNAQGGTGEYELNGGTLYVNQAGAAQGFVIGNQTGANGLLLQTGGTFTAMTGIVVGGSGTGVYTITGGLATFNGGVSVGSQGTINLDGGIVQVGGTDGISGNTGAVINGAGGVLQVINSSFSTNVQLTLASNTRTIIDTNGFDASFDGGVVNTSANNGGLSKIGSGTLNFTGTTNSIASFYTLGGTTTQGTGTTLTSYEMGIGYGTGDTASYVMSGGNLILAAGQAPALVGGPGTLSSLRVGDFGGTGYFIQTGGTVTDYGALSIGNRGGTGLYAISSGTLALANTLNVIGRNDTADGYSGGSYPNLGSSHGTLDISGDALVSVASGGKLILGSNIATTVASVAQGSTGTIVQSGGTLQIQSGAALYFSAVGSGEYDLNGGTLQVGGSSGSGQGLIGNYNNMGGSYTFNLGGGTIQVYGSDLSTNVNATLTGTSTSTIDTNGLNATLSGTLGGTGNLTKIGAGTLTLSNGNNSFSGNMLVSAGALIATNTSGSAIGTSTLNVSSGATVGGPGRMTPGSFTISGTVQVGNGVGVDTTSHFSLLNSAASSLTNATLQFNINTVTQTSNELHLGTGTIAFNNDTLSLNVTQWAGGYTTSQLILIDNESLTDIYSGLTLGGTDQFGNTYITGGLTIEDSPYFGSMVNGVVTSGLGAGSYLFLNTLNGEIGIEVVPEPSTWALMLAGLALLVGLRRKIKIALR